jgi:DNA invertase Pin-like site-specific DNA recombinase
MSLMRPSVPRPKAYSYLRFSTPEQMKGDSFRRQSTMATSYATRKGLELDTSLTFHDLGVSAYKGANAEAGRLADFLEAVKAGLVPRGAYLLVEALDRLSRMSPRKALRVLEDIAEQEITVVTLNDEREYTTASLDRDPIDLLVAITVFMRANEESATKARRLSSAWEGKRLSATSVPMTSLTPAWIRLDKSGDKPELQLIPERVEVVQRIYRQALEGIGHESIARALSAEGVPCFGRAQYWHKSYISKILKNPAVVGTLIPHRLQHVGSKSVRVPLDPIEDYYPAAVDRQTFDACQQLGNTAHVVRQRQGQLANLLGGLAVCPVCGGSMTRVNKGSSAGGKPKLVCARAKTGAGCQYVGVTLEQVEECILAKAAEFTGLAPIVDEGLEDQLLALEEGIDHMLDQLRNLTDALAAGASVAISTRIHEIELALVEAQKERDELLGRLEATSNLIMKHRLQAVDKALQADPVDRAQANAALRSILSSVVVDYRSGELLFKWKHGGVSGLRYAWPQV